MTRFKAPVEHNRTQDGEHRAMGRFPGMPVGVQLLSDWHVHHVQFTTLEDFVALSTNNWTFTETGAGGTIAASADLFPPHVIVTTDALDNDSEEAQFTSTGAGEIVDLTADRPVYFEAMIRLRDAGNVDAAVEQVDWFVGLAVTDTTVIDGATDFIGFLKRDLTDDATCGINFVCGDAGGAAGALVDQLVTATGWSSLNPVETQATDRGNRILGANQWIKLAFLIEPEGSGARGFAWVWVNDQPIPNNPINVAGFIPNENICLTFAIQNGEAVIKNMDIHHLLVCTKLFDDAGVMV